MTLVARPVESYAPLVHPADVTRGREQGSDPRAHEARLAGAAGSRYQEERRSCFSLLAQELGHPQSLFASTVEDRSVLGFVGGQTAERAALPTNGRSLLGFVVPQQLADVGLEALCELVGGLEVAVRAKERGLPTAKCLLPVLVELDSLPGLSHRLSGIAVRQSGGEPLAVEQDVGLARRPRRLQRRFELELSAGTG